MNRTSSASPSRTPVDTNSFDQAVDTKRIISGCHLGQPSLREGRNGHLLYRQHVVKMYVTKKCTHELTNAFALCPDFELSSTTLVETSDCSSASATGASVLPHQLIIACYFQMSKTIGYRPHAARLRARGTLHQLLRKHKYKLSFN